MGVDLYPKPDGWVIVVRYVQVKGVRQGGQWCGTQKRPEQGGFAIMMSGELGVKCYLWSFTHNYKKGDRRDVEGGRATGPTAVSLQEG